MTLYTGHFNKKLCNAAILVFPLAITACSFSDSSGSISDSTSSIISSPSSVSEEDKKYENEVSDYTMAYVKSSRPDADYNSYLKGLKKAGIQGTAYETYKKNFANSNQQNMQNIQKGYESEH